MNGREGPQDNKSNNHWLLSATCSDAVGIVTLTLAFTATSNSADNWRGPVRLCQIVELDPAWEHGEGTDHRAYAATTSSISDPHRAAKSRRCSGSGTYPARRAGARRYWRHSANAEKNRTADAKLPKPSIG